MRGVWVCIMDGWSLGVYHGVLGRGGRGVVCIYDLALPSSSGSVWCVGYEVIV